MRGPLGYWGHDTRIAVVSRLEPSDINGQSGVVAGYPGDTCGTKILTGTKAEKERKIDDCWLRRNDEWASRQWKDVGTMQVPADVRLVHHTADTFKGESGGPICMTRAQTLHLVGIHTDEDTPQRNKGMRVTRRMLEDLAGWIERRCRLDNRRGQERHARVQDGDHDDQHAAGQGGRGLLAIRVRRRRVGGRGRTRRCTGRRVRSRLGPARCQRGAGSRQA